MTYICIKCLHIVYSNQALLSTIYANEGEKSICTIVIDETVLH